MCPVWTRTGWLATQCRPQPSPRQFLANRQFYREFRGFQAFRDRFRGEKPLCPSAFSCNSLRNQQG